MKDRSFKILEGMYNTIFSAPHAVEQMREGKLKASEPETGRLVEILNEQYGYSGIIKIKNENDDANYDSNNPYKEYLIDYIEKKDIKLLFDLHQLASNREMDLCIGTGCGNNIQNDFNYTNIITSEFQKMGMKIITVDHPFSAGNPYTVSAYVSHIVKIPCIQLEFNSNIFRKKDIHYQIASTLDEIIKRF